MRERFLHLPSCRRRKDESMIKALMSLPPDRLAIIFPWLNERPRAYLISFSASLFIYFPFDSSLSCIIHERTLLLLSYSTVLHCFLHILSRLYLVHCMLSVHSQRKNCLVTYLWLEYWLVNSFTICNSTSWRSGQISTGSMAAITKQCSRSSLLLAMKRAGEGSLSFFSLSESLDSG